MHYNYITNITGHNNLNHFQSQKLIQSTSLLSADSLKRKTKPSLTYSMNGPVSHIPTWYTAKLTHNKLHLMDNKTPSHLLLYSWYRQCSKSQSQWVIMKYYSHPYGPELTCLVVGKIGLQGPLPLAQAAARSMGITARATFNIHKLPGFSYKHPACS